MSSAQKALSAPPATRRVDRNGEVVHYDESSGAGSAFKGFRENWEKCNPKYWIVRPQFNYKFDRASFKKIHALLTAKEISAFDRAYSKIGFITRSATAAGIPYALGVSIVQKKKREKKAAMAEVAPPKDNPTVLDRLEWIQGQTLAYLEKVVRSEGAMAQVGYEGVLTIFDRVSRVSTSIVNSKDSAETAIEVISSIPLSNSEKEADA